MGRFKAMEGLGEAPSAQESAESGVRSISQEQNLAITQSILQRGKQNQPEQSDVEDLLAPDLKVNDANGKERFIFFHTGTLLRRIDS
jgi:hypothetical protein